MKLWFCFPLIKKKNKGFLFVKKCLSLALLSVVTFGSMESFFCFITISGKSMIDKYGFYFSFKSRRVEQ